MALHPLNTTPADDRSTLELLTKHTALAFSLIGTHRDRIKDFFALKLRKQTFSLLILIAKFQDHCSARPLPEAHSLRLSRWR
jgi:hypothetical protein